MPSTPDLFVVCKQCGAEVSPYITECPYCGHRLRRRAPKLPREGEQPPRARRAHRRGLERLRRGGIPGIKRDARPYATIALVVVTALLWIGLGGDYVGVDKLIFIGASEGHWWR